jgi:hypothetical protein
MDGDGVPCSTVKLVNPRTGGPLGLCVVLSLAACNPRESAPTPAPAGSPAGSIAASATPPSSTAPPTPSAAPAPTPNKKSADTWLAVRKDGVEIGLIELRAGKPPTLTVETDNADAAALKTKLAEIGGPGGIPLNMHLPSPSGTGRGPYGARIINYADPLYRHAVTEELEPTFSVKEVKQLDDPSPPAGLKRVQVSRSGEKVGSLDFGSTPPKLTVDDMDKADGMSLKNAWEHIQTLPELRVRYHTLKDATQTLVIARAKPGDASYGEVVVLHLMVEREYLARFAYKLEFFQ